MEYVYEYTHQRGPGPGCQPKGQIEIHHDRGKYGAVVYSNPLSEAEQSDYDLRPLTED